MPHACAVHRFPVRAFVATHFVNLPVLKACFFLVALIGGSPAILLVGGLVMHALVAGIVAIALVIVARSLRPGETEFLVSRTRPLAFAAAVPALWVLIQILPLNLFVHPIWISAAQALGRPVAGAISIDPGASVIALGQYLSMAAVTFLSAAVAVDRQRAQWLLFALAGACTAIALGVLIHDLFFPGVRLTAFARSQSSTARAWEQLSPAPPASARSSATRHATQIRTDRFQFCGGR